VVAEKLRRSKHDATTSVSFHYAVKTKKDLAKCGRSFDLNQTASHGAAQRVA
jgi:hypothetical protein